MENTDYPSNDKPWLKYYCDTVFRNDLASTIFHRIYEHNKSYLDDVAILFYGRKITYQKLFQETDSCASALISLGVKKGDCISLCMSSVPEAIYLVLACCKIGTIANFINPLFSKEQMIDRINDTGAQLLFILDKMLSFIEDIVPVTCIKKVIYIPYITSMPKITACFLKITQQQEKKNRSFINWTTFIKMGKDTEAVELAYEKDLGVVMVYSSGTTGASKGILLTNDGINATISHYLSSDFIYRRQDKFLQIIPIWFSTGIVLSILMPLCLGITLIPELVFSKESFTKAIAKNKPEMTLAANSLWMYAIRTKELDHIDLSNLVYPISGGETISIQSENEINEFLQEHHCKSKLIKGYGMCELGSTITTTSFKHSKLESAGYPIKNVIVSAFDMKTNQEKKYNKRGEIRVCSPARMKEYYKNVTATQAFFWKDIDNRIWGCTGDIGYVDEDGDVFILGRAEDSFVSEQGEIIYLFDIERVVLKEPEISQCKAIALNCNGISVPVLHIVLKTNYLEYGLELIQKIDHKCSEVLPSAARPIAYKLRKSFPVHPNGKRNTKSLEEEKDGYIDFKGNKFQLF